jgi:hypothetical protein
MLKGVLQQLDSQPTSGARRAVALIVVVAAVAFLGFTIWIALQYRSSNSWSEIREVVDPIVAWTVVAVVTACAAVIVDTVDRRHAVRLAQMAGATAPAATAPAGSVVVSGRAWRGTALAGLAIVAFSLALVASHGLGHLRSTTTFGLRLNTTIQACVATLWAPSTATTEDRVAIDLSVYCKDAPIGQMPPVAASFGPESGGGDPGEKVVTSFAAAKTQRVSERVWRWFVTFPSGEQPLDVRLTFAGDRVVVPLGRIGIGRPTTLASLQEQTTAIGGLLGALIGVLGTLGALFRSWRNAASTTVVTPADT